MVQLIMLVWAIAFQTQFINAFGNWFLGLLVIFIFPYTSIAFAAFPGSWVALVIGIVLDILRYNATDK